MIGMCVAATDEVVGELPWRNLRLVVAYDPYVASKTQALRQEKIKALEAQADAWVGKLDAQDAGPKARGKKLSDSGAKARLYHAVKDARLAHIVRADLKNELFAYDIDQDALALAELMDGKLLLVTNTPDLSTEKVVARYKFLADIERGFWVLKSEIEIGPVFHRLPERSVSRHMPVLAFLYRVMRQRLVTVTGARTTATHSASSNPHQPRRPIHHWDLPALRYPRPRLRRSESQKNRSATATIPFVVHVFEPRFLIINHLRV